MVKALFVLAALGATAAKGNGRPVSRPIAGYIKERIAEFDQIPSERREELEKIAAYVRDQNRTGSPARLTFICTHNSRRSQMCQVWAQAAAAYYGIRVESFSGGAEATAFNSRAVAALKRAGFDIAAPGPADNPRYLVRFAAAGEPVKCFSKVYNEPPNPKHDFCAVMTCSQADQSCPEVAGASLRIALHYLDPKLADDTPAETATYDERCAQIAREMLFVGARAGC